jgi:hypothetical protein
VPSSRDAALRNVTAVASGADIGAKVALRYVARAGLLPELSRQTYDSFPKALREAVLNSLDADATRVDIDFSQIEVSRQMTVVDDGVGMSMPDFCVSDRSPCSSTPRRRRSRRNEPGVPAAPEHGSNTRGTSGAMTGAPDSTRWLPALQKSSRTTGHESTTSHASPSRT